MGNSFLFDHAAPRLKRIARNHGAATNYSHAFADATYAWSHHGAGPVLDPLPPENFAGACIRDTRANE